MFPEHERELLEALFVVESFREGTVFIQEGTRAVSNRSAVYLLLEGEVHVSRRRPRADAYTFETILHPPELFGIISLATDLPHSATCRARTDCLVAHLDRPAFVELHHEHSALGARFEHMLARQLVRDLRRLTRDLLDAFESGDPKALRSSIGGLS